MQAPNSRHLAAMAVKRPTTQTGGPPPKRAHIGGVAAESVARMLGVVGVAESPSSTVSFGRAGFAAHMDKVELQAVAQDLLQAAQQRPRSHVAAPSINAPSSVLSSIEVAEQLPRGTDIKTEGDPAGAAINSTAVSAAGVGAYAARERAVVDCFVAIVQQAAASCTQSQLQLQHQHQQPASHQHGAAPGRTAAARAPMESGGSEGVVGAESASADNLT